MRRGGDIGYANTFGDGSGVVEYGSFEDMRNAIRTLDDSEFRNPFDKAIIRVREDDGRGRGGGGRRRSRSRSHGRRRRSRSPHRRSRSPRHRSRSWAAAPASKKSRSRSRSPAARSNPRSRAPAPKRKSPLRSLTVSSSKVAGTALLWPWIFFLLRRLMPLFHLFADGPVERKREEGELMLR